MGFRSSFTSEWYPIKWPQWFRDRYKDTCHVPECGGLSSIGESKVYSAWTDLLTDVQKAIDWAEWDRAAERWPRWGFVILFLHECGGVTKAWVGRDRIVMSEPANWNKVDGVTHSYCNGCSTVEGAGK